MDGSIFPTSETVDLPSKTIKSPEFGGRVMDWTGTANKFCLVKDVEYVNWKKYI